MIGKVEETACKLSFRNDSQFMLWKWTAAMIRKSLLKGEATPTPFTIKHPI